MIGKSVGEKNSNLALLYYRIGQICASVIALIQIFLLVVLKKPLIDFFDMKQEIHTTIDKTWHVFVLFTFVDAICILSATIIRSTGKQCLGVMLTISAYTVLAIPMTWLLG